MNNFVGHFSKIFLVSITKNEKRTVPIFVKKNKQNVHSNCVYSQLSVKNVQVFFIYLKQFVNLLFFYMFNIFHKINLYFIIIILIFKLFIIFYLKMKIYDFLEYNIIFLLILYFVYNNLKK